MNGVVKKLFPPRMQVHRRPADSLTGASFFAALDWPKGQVAQPLRFAELLPQGEDMNFTKTKAFADWTATTAKEHASEDLPSETSEDLEIPPYLRRPERGTREYAQWILSMIDSRVAKLADKELRPHPQLVTNRLHCLDFLEGRIPELDSERFIVRRKF